MFIKPLGTEYVQRTIQTTSAKFFPSHLPMGAINKENIVVKKLLPEMPYVYAQEAPKSVIEKITSIFW